MICCDKDQSTAFCAYCGSKLEDPLLSLRRHVNTRFVECKKRYNERKARFDNGEIKNKPGGYSIVEKWEKWLKALNNAIALLEIHAPQ